jgi:hypothetical protein
MPFQPGQSGNPQGAPRKAKIFTNALLASLKKTDSEDVEAIQRIADKLVALAASGDVAAIKEVADRAEGRVPQAIGGDDELGAIKAEVTVIQRHILDHAANSDS